MRICELDIDQFGVWKNISLPLSESGITVLYGPNEAGKSTLMRFVRAVLFGYQSQDLLDAGRHQQPSQCGGAITVSHNGKSYHVRRLSQAKGPGELQIDGRPHSEQSALYQEILGGVSESLFRDVFAIGLNELQQLATLSGEEVANEIYGTSLGPEGDLLARSHIQIQQRIDSLVDRSHKKGKLFVLADELAELDREQQRLGSPVDRYDRLQAQRHQFNGQIDQLKTRQHQLQEDLRGFQFLRRIWEPWKKERDLRSQLDRLSNYRFDQTLLEEYDQLEAQLRKLQRSRKNVVDEVKQLLNEAKAISIRKELVEEQCAIQQLAHEVPELRQLEADRHHEGPPADDLSDEEVSDILDRIDGNWTVDSLLEVDLSPSSLQALSAAAHAEQSVLRSRDRLTKRYQKLHAKYKKVAQSQDGKAAGQTNEDLESKEQELREAINELEELRGLRIRKVHLHDLLETLSASPELETDDSQFPQFFHSVLFFFVVAGVILLLFGSYGAVHGVVSGGFHAAIIGACYAFLGTASLGTCWTINHHYSRRKFRVSETSDVHRSIREDLADIDLRIQRILSRRILSKKRPGHQSDVNEWNQDEIDVQISALREELDRIRETAARSRRLQRLRRRLSQLRDRLQKIQKVLGQKRTKWSECLRTSGLPVSLTPPQTFELCQQISAAREMISQRRELEHHRLPDRSRLEKFHQRVQEIGRKLDELDAVEQDPFGSVARWNHELSGISDRRRHRAELRKQGKAKRIQAQKLARELTRLKQHQARLLSDLGVNDRDEIDEMMLAIEERNELERKLQEVGDLIGQIVETEPDVVIVEDQLLDYDEASVKQQIEEIQAELLEIDEALQAKYQSIGKVNQETDALESDRTASLLRFERAQIINEIGNSGRSLFAWTYADKAMGVLLERIERERQPDTLIAASKLLEQLTCSKYNKIWAPLGEQLLMVDDEAGQSFRVEHLSSGTREQVFLAIRMALIQGFARDGLELPLILDDVTVNFDQIRTEAALQTILDFAENGQQVVLLTCHLHLAHLFEQHGIEPVWLPANRPEVSV